MTISKNIPVIAVIALILAGAYFLVPQVSGAANSAGLQSRVATSSTIVVGIQENKTLFTENEICAARIVSTAGQSVMLSFSSAVAPSALVGHVQPASTTVAYDSQTYGCGAITAYGHTSSTTITTTETRF